MLILGIDTASKTASVGISDGGKMIVNFTLNHKRTHSEKLLEMIDNALNIAQLDISDIDAFAVCKGPGSFTGLRIGLSTVKGLCHALNKPCYLCSTLSMLYENVRTEEKDVIYVPCMDARRSEVYTAAFCNNERILEDSAMPVSELIKKLDEYNSALKVIFTGDGILPNIETLKNHFKERFCFAEEGVRYGSGYAVITAAIKEENKVDYENILPSYLRPSQAEREKAI